MNGTYTYTITDYGMRKRTLQEVIEVKIIGDTMYLTSRRHPETISIKMYSVKSIEPMFVRY